MSTGGSLLSMGSSTNDNTNNKRKHGGSLTACSPKEPTAVEKFDASIMLSTLPRPQALGQVVHEEDWNWEDIYEALSLYQALDGEPDREVGYVVRLLQRERIEETRPLHNSNKKARPKPKQQGTIECAQTHIGCIKAYAC
jgi:hypothetical protein